MENIEKRSSLTREGRSKRSIPSARHGKAEESMGTSHRELLMQEVRVGRWDRTAARRKCLNPVSEEERDSARQRRLGRPSQGRKQLTQG